MNLVKKDFDNFEMLLLNDNDVTIGINGNQVSDLLTISIDTNNIGNDNPLLMEFYFDANNYLMKNVGNLYFNSSLNLATTTVEIHLDNEEFITQVIEKIQYIFSLHQHDIKKEISKNSNKTNAILKMA